MPLELKTFKGLNYCYTCGEYPVVSQQGTLNLREYWCPACKAVVRHPDIEMARAAWNAMQDPNPRWRRERQQLRNIAKTILAIEDANDPIQPPNLAQALEDWQKEFGNDE